MQPTVPPPTPTQALDYLRHLTEQLPLKWQDTQMRLAADAVLRQVIAAAATPADRGRPQDGPNAD